MVAAKLQGVPRTCGLPGMTFDVELSYLRVLPSPGFILSGESRNLAPSQPRRNGIHSNL